jgi:hypothetical protein
LSIIRSFLVTAFVVDFFWYNVSLIVDVKLSSTKTAKIAIWRGDDPYTLAESFAKIYSLEARARDLLVNVIRQSMSQNDLLPPEVEENILASNSCDLADGTVNTKRRVGGNIERLDGRNHDRGGMHHSSVDAEADYYSDGDGDSNGDEFDNENCEYGSSAGEGERQGGEDDEMYGSASSESRLSQESDISSDEASLAGSVSNTNSGSLTA